MPTPSGAERLDLVFRALANPTRRHVVEQLGRGPATTTELRRAFYMAMPSFLQHLRLLEASGIVTSTRAGRVRTYQLVPRRLRLAEEWLARLRSQ